MSLSTVLLVRFLFLLSLIPTISYGQEKILAIRTLRADGFSYYDFNGKKLFSTPPGDEPAVKAENEPYYLGNFYIIDFSAGVLPVESENGSYLLNSTGKKIKQFGFPTNHIAPPVDGYIRVLSRYLERRNNSLIQYYNIKGDPAFGGKGYWEGSTIKAGKAVVQILIPGKESNEQTGEWLLIDSTGKTIKNITTETGEIISRIAEEKADGWKLSIKENYSKYIYLRPNGDYSYTPFPYVPETEPKHPSKASHNMDSLLHEKFGSSGYIKTYPKLFFKDKGYLIMPSQQASSRGVSILADDHLKEIPLTINGKNVKPIRFLGKYHIITALVVDNLTTFPVIDLQTMQSDYTMDVIPYNIIDGLMITYSEKTAHSQTVAKVINEFGKVIYTPSPETRVFTSVAEAMEFADKVTNLSLKGSRPEDLQGIEKLTHLHTLELIDYKGTELPPVYWKELENIAINKCSSLSTLPSSFRKIKSIKHVTILGSKNLQAIESFIPDWPALKSLKTDLRLPEGIRQKYPNVNFPDVLVEVLED